ncbi:hypothetical protein LINPERPRIM_LOCUS24739 [Linum perenne]
MPNIKPNRYLQRICNSGESESSAV